MKYDYDVAVIGGGAAGLTASGMSVNFGAKTLLVESSRLGGDCTWHGCIPSKTLLNAARLSHEIQKTLHLEVPTMMIASYGSKVFEQVRNIRQKVYEDADQPSIYQKMGIDVVFGMASFKDAHTLFLQNDVGSSTITSRYFIIATGAKAYIPPIEGLSGIPFLTNESLFELDDLPGSLSILGGGPIGIEMAQAFNRLGTHVTVIDVLPHILSNDDQELTDYLKKDLRSEGIQFHLSSKVERFEKINRQSKIHFTQNGQQDSILSDQILIATGRRSNITYLDSEAAGINVSEKGIPVDDHCRTNIRNIYACGDVTGRYQLTHMSEHMAKIAVTNALLKLPVKIDKKYVPWCIFTDPELAHVGATEKELISKGVSYKTYRFPFSKIDRAITDDTTHGLIKVHAKEWNGKILGVSIMGARAGDLIAEYTLAMKNGVTMRKISDTIHPYPTYALGNRRAADQWYVQRQSVTLVKWLKRIFRYRVPLPDVSDPDRIV